MVRFELFVTNCRRFGDRRLGLATPVTVLAFAYSMWALYGAGAEVVIWGTLLMLAGLLIYVWLKWQGRSVGEPLAHSPAE
jgi:APA family basic amino acid/polyamine antiporter